MTDPFDALASPPEAQAPRPRFARQLRARIVTELGLDAAPDVQPTIDLPERKPRMSTTTTAPTTTPIATGVTPYLTADDAAAALDWYAEAFGAVEQYRIVGDDGLIGHAEFHIGSATFYLSDEHPEIGVVAPTSLGGTPTAMHLQVTDVDGLYARAVAAGATAQRPPEDQAHGARHGTLLDPYGHRWMLSQHIEDVDEATMAARMEGSGYRLDVAGGLRRGGQRYVDGIWGSMTYADPEAGIRFVTEVLGFEELVLVRDDHGGIVHSEYRWPEGGIFGISAADDTNPFLPPPGRNGLYVVTADPHTVWERCRAAGVEVIREPDEPHYDPGGMSFSVRDPEGNAWSFGTYTGGATE